MSRVDEIVNEATDLASCDEQYEIAQRIAANVGYRLVPENSIQATEDHGDVLMRLNRLETAVLELNPGLSWRA